MHYDKSELINKTIFFKYSWIRASWYGLVETTNKMQRCIRIYYSTVISEYNNNNNNNNKF